MSNNTINALAASIKNLLEAAIQNNVAGAATLAAALDTALTADRVTENSNSQSCESKFNKVRTLCKSYNTAGFTDKTLKIVVRSLDNHDEIVIMGANDYREPIHEVIECPCRLDRSSLKAQLRLGVLKITGRTYKSSVELSEMDLSTVKLVPEMKA